MTTPFPALTGATFDDLVRAAGGAIDTPEALYEDYQAEFTNGNAERLLGRALASDDMLTFEEFGERLDRFAAKVIHDGVTYVIGLECPATREGYVKRNEAFLVAKARCVADRNPLIGIVATIAEQDPGKAIQMAVRGVAECLLDGEPEKALDYRTFTTVAFEQAGATLPVDAFSELAIEAAKAEIKAQRETAAAAHGDADPIAMLERVLGGPLPAGFPG